MIFGQTPADAKKDEKLREFNSKITSMRQDKELLQAQVDESDWHVYERGPIQEELIELREGSVTKEREIASLQRENRRLKADLNRSEAIVANAGRRHAPHPPGHPHEERATINQHFINTLFDNAKTSG